MEDMGAYFKTVGRILCMSIRGLCELLGGITLFLFFVATDQNGITTVNMCVNKAGGLKSAVCLIGMLALGYLFKKAGSECINDIQHKRRI